MKKSVYVYKTLGKNSIDLEILLDAGRELTDTDSSNIRRCVEGIVNALNDESMNLDPEVKGQVAQDKREIVSLFAGKQIFVEEVENEYAIKPYANHHPWYVVTTPKGRIKIGWRKRVLCISWDETTIEGTAKELFPDEDVTKFDKTIHAWGYDKAQEYIDVLLK